MSVTSIISALEEKTKNLEQAIAQSIQNHSGLLGMLQGTKEALADAMKVVDLIAPKSGVAELLNVADNVVNDLEALFPAGAGSDVEPVVGAE